MKWWRKREKQQFGDGPWTLGKTKSGPGSGHSQWKAPLTSLLRSHYWRNFQSSEGHLICQNVSVCIRVTRSNTWVRTGGGQDHLTHLSGRSIRSHQLPDSLIKGEEWGRSKRHKESSCFTLFYSCWEGNVEQRQNNLTIILLTLLSNKIKSYHRTEVHLNQWTGSWLDPSWNLSSAGMWQNLNLLEPSETLELGSSGVSDGIVTMLLLWMFSKVQANEKWLEIQHNKLCFWESVTAKLNNKNSQTERKLVNPWFPAVYQSSTWGNTDNRPVCTVQTVPLRPYRPGSKHWLLLWRTEKRRH